MSVPTNILSPYSASSPVTDSDMPDLVSPIGDNGYERSVNFGEVFLDMSTSHLRVNLDLYLQVFNFLESNLWPVLWVKIPAGPQVPEGH
jgi:hypothetical protein